jgi:hypothetical protein
MAIISAVVGIKEHKYKFQYLSNEHQGVSKFTVLCGNAGLLGADIESLGRKCIYGGLAGCRSVERGLHHSREKKLFPAEFRPSLAPLLRLAVVLVIAFAAAAWPAWHGASSSLPRCGGRRGCSTGWFVLLAFGLNEVRAVFRERIRRRFAPAGP